MSVSNSNGHHDLVPSGNGHAVGVTYAEVRDWATWLGAFTASDLAYSMAVDQAIADRGLRALLWHGAVEPTGDWIDGPVGPEEIVHYVTFKYPPDPNEHPHEPPEWVTCDREILCPRGLPIRMISDRDRRKAMSSNMAMRRVLKERDRRWNEMEAAKLARAEKQKAKAQKEPKWKRRK